MTGIERFDKFIIPVPWSGCWIWLGGRAGEYGSFTLTRWRPKDLPLDSGKRRRHVLVHRYIYELLTETKIPDGMVCDHLCRVKLCVNPNHIEVVDQRTNTLRGVGPTARAVRKTHCPQGHPYAGDNLFYHTPKGKLPSRLCRTCSRIKAKLWEAKHQRQPRYRLKGLMIKTLRAIFIDRGPTF